MHRVDTSTAVAVMPAAEAPGVPGFFTKGDPVGGLPATVPGPDMFNMIQEELVAILEAFGVTPDQTKADYGQIIDALLANFANIGGNASQLFRAAPGVASNEVVVLSQLAAYLPTGAVLANPSGIVPSGFLECDGAAVSRIAYANLFSLAPIAIGTMYGVGDGVTTFNLPDYRGKFLRGWDHGAGVDPDAASRTDRGDGTTGDNVGTDQVDIFKSHNHTYSSTGTLTATAGTGAGQQSGVTGATGGAETRPINTNVMYIIKY